MDAAKIRQGEMRFDLSMDYLAGWLRATVRQAVDMADSNIDPALSGLLYGVAGAASKALSEVESGASGLLGKERE